MLRISGRFHSRFQRCPDFPGQVPVVCHVVAGVRLRPNFRFLRFGSAYNRVPEGSYAWLGEKLGCLDTSAGAKCWELKERSSHFEPVDTLGADPKDPAGELLFKFLRFYLLQFIEGLEIQNLRYQGQDDCLCHSVGRLTGRGGPAG